MKDQIYNLVDAVDGKVLRYGVTLNRAEVSVLNYAYALNGKRPRYVLETEMTYQPS